MNTKFANMLFSTSNKVQFCLLFDRFVIASITSEKNLIQHAFLTFYTQDSCCVIWYNLEWCLIGEKKKKTVTLQASFWQCIQEVHRRMPGGRWRGRRWPQSSRWWTCGCARWCTWAWWTSPSLRYICFTFLIR